MIGRAVLAQSVERPSCHIRWGSSTLNPGLEPHQCFYVDLNGSAATLATKEVSRCHTRGESYTPQQYLIQQSSFLIGKPYLVIIVSNGL